MRARNHSEADSKAFTSDRQGHTHGIPIFPKSHYFSRPVYVHRSLPFSAAARPQTTLVRAAAPIHRSPDVPYPPPIFLESNFALARARTQIITQPGRQDSKPPPKLKSSQYQQKRAKLHPNPEYYQRAHALAQRQSYF